MNTFYSANGDMFTIESFNEVEGDKKEKVNISKIIYSHLKVQNLSDNKHKTFYPVYAKKLEDGVFLLGTKPKLVKHNLLTTNNNISKIDNDESNIDDFKIFRINNSVLEILKGGSYKPVELVNNSLDEGNKENQKVHFFKYSNTGTTVKIYYLLSENDINKNVKLTTYKINKSRDSFYLAADPRKTRFLKASSDDVLSKSEASLFKLYPIEQDFKVNFTLPERDENEPEEKFNSRQIKAKNEINEFATKTKYNLVLKDGDNCKALKLIRDELGIDESYDSNNDCTISKKEEDNMPYKLLILI